MMQNTGKSLVDLEKERYTKATWAFVLCFGIMGIITLIMGLMGKVDIIILAIVEMVAGISFGVYRWLNARKRRKAYAAQLENVAFCVENTTKTAVKTFPSPMVVTTVSGAVQWYNEKFENLLEHGGIYGEYIQDIFPEIPFSRFVEDGNPTPVELTYKDRTYVVTGRAVRTNQNGVIGTMIGIYFTEVTLIKNLRKSIEDKKIVAAYLMIDNYDEVLKSTPNQCHGALLGDIERCINEWVEKGEGVKVRYERDRFVIFFEARNFETIMNEKFSILNEVKTINHENRLPVTLSIGVGRNGENISENERYGSTALEMALGRGGDQAVVKTALGYQFFGARSREVEKSTRVKVRVVAHALRDLADTSSNVIIMGHKNADADSFGASVGLFRALRDRNVKAYIAMDKANNNVKLIMDWLSKIKEYNECIINQDRAMSIIDDNTLLIVVDTHRPTMVEYSEVLKSVKNIVLIDHHRRSEDFIENSVLALHEPFASSSCEMVAEMLQYFSDKQNMESAEAEAIYSGIYLDTKGFNFKTGVRTFEAASYLRKLGANPINIRRLFRNDLNIYVEKSRIISNAKVYRNNIAIAVSDYNGENAQLIVAQAADDLLDIKGIEAAFVLALVDGKVIISGRSLDTVNVQVILEKLGGGGHITIAGAQLKNNSLSFAEQKLRMAIDEVLFDEAPIIEIRPIK